MLLIIAVCTLLCGGETFYDMEEFGHAKRDWFESFLDSRTGSYRTTPVQTIEKGHGRIETRRYYQSDQLAWFADPSAWEGLTSVGWWKPCAESMEAEPPNDATTSSACH